MKVKSHYIRLLVLSCFFCTIVALIGWRVLDLTVLDRQFLKEQGDARSLRIQDIPAHRGMIMDRNGVPLAISTPVTSVWINPKNFNPDEKQFNQLLKLLSLSKLQLASTLKHAGQREFIYLKRQLPPAMANQIEELKIPGVNFQQEFKRYYPETDSTAQLIGFTNIDDIGIEGMELVYQDWLKGEPGKKRVVKDRTGHIIEDLGVIKEPHPGQDLMLSIDRRIQYLAYHELKNTIDQFAAKWGSVVVLDTKTGEVLAIANYPSFNPNARGRYTRDYYRNRAATDVFEPGSVIKPFSIASALSTGLFRPDTIIDTRPSQMTVQGKLIRDDHSYGVLDVTGVLKRSSNVGVSKMVLASPPEQLINLLLRFGFNQRTESGYPGESDGTMVHVKDASPFVLATISFGYGLSVTALQLAKAYAVFANQGNSIPISLLHTNRPPEQVERVLEQKTAQQVLKMMQAVLEEGTGKMARVSGYRVAGKTGTARIAGKKGYEADKHMASFVGIAPVSDPRLVVVVVIREPTKHGYYAASVAAPLFSRVMGGTLRSLNILPDA